MTDVAARLLDAFGPDMIRLAGDVPARNLGDWTGPAAAPPLALALPRSVDEVAAVVRLCHEVRCPIAVQGGLTGLAAGATPGPGEVALSLERLSGVEEVDTAAATMTVLAGTPLETAQSAAEAAGFLFPVDLGSRGSCSVGGVVSTNAGGVQVVRYGMTRASVRGLEVVLADGTVVTGLNRMLKNNAGLDWTQLFVGSEGTLGIVTRVVFSLQARPQASATGFLVVPDFAAALVTLRYLQGEMPGALLAFEAMWPDYVAFARVVCNAPAPLDPGRGLSLIVEATTGEGGRDAFEASLADLAERGVVLDAVMAKSEEERRRIWTVRERPAAEYPVKIPGHVDFDVSIPLGSFSAAVEAIAATLAARWPGLTALFYGHVADSNLHLVTHRAAPGPLPREEVVRTVYDVVGRFGGSISAEHGIGRLKRAYLDRSRSPAERALMRRIKDALDPDGILNPGRIL